MQPASIAADLPKDDVQCPPKVSLAQLLHILIRDAIKVLLKIVLSDKHSILFREKAVCNNTPNDSP